MDREPEEEVSSKAEPEGGRVRRLGHYAVKGVVPALSILALVIALAMFAGTRSDRHRLDEASARIKGLDASLSAANGELESLKLSMAREKAMRREEQKGMDERDAEIVRHVTHLETKLKVAPTLEAQLHAAAGRSTGAQPAGEPDAAGHVPGTAVSRQAVAPLPAEAGKAPDPEAGNLSSQAKAIKEAIEKFNRQ